MSNRSPDVTFAALGLSPELCAGAAAAGYTAPTPVQELAVPRVLEGCDVIAQAKTGTGKTAAFALPLLQIVLRGVRGAGVGALVVAPTRELALQVEQACAVYAQKCAVPFRSVSVIGGLSIDAQTAALAQGADIVVATPGRLLDLLERRAIDLSALKVLVVDEADKMFSLGFADELAAVLKALPARRQNLLFSATVTDAVRALAETFMHEPVFVDADDDGCVSERIAQRVIEVDRGSRGMLLRHLIKTEHWTHVLVFVGSARAADNLSTKLNGAGIKARAFHGSLTQEQRIISLRDFKHKRIVVLVATDLASRGIDIEKLPHVVNYDLPRSPNDYVHRVGRVARAGETGTAVSFVGAEDFAHFRLIEKRAGIRLSRERVPGFEPTDARVYPEKGKAPVKGHRMSKKDKARAAAAKKTAGDA